MRKEYTYIEIPSSHFSRVPAYEKWLKEAMGYASLSTWYHSQYPGGAMLNALGFHHHSTVMVFYSEEDALYFKLACPVDSGWEPYEDRDGDIVYRRIQLPR